MKLNNVFYRSIPLGPDQILLRGAMLRNTRWVFGVVVYTGHDTKLLQNNTASAPLKRSTLDRVINTQILMMFLILIVLSFFLVISNLIWTNGNKVTHWYLDIPGNEIFSFMKLHINLLMNNLILLLQILFS